MDLNEYLSDSKKSDLTIRKEEINKERGNESPFIRMVQRSSSVHNIQYKTKTDQLSQSNLL